MRSLCLRRVQAAGEVRRAGRVAGGKEEKRREGEDVFGWDARGLSVRCRGWGRVRSAGARGWNGKCRGIRSVVSLVALCAVERVVPQPIGSDSRWRRGIGNNVRSSNARVSSYVTMLQKFELSRQTSGSRCATETVGLVLSCLFFDIFGMGDYRYFRGRSCLASNPHDRLSLA